MLSRATRCKNPGYVVSPYRFSRRRSPFPFLAEGELRVFVLTDHQVLTVALLSGWMNEELPYLG